MDFDAEPDHEMNMIGRGNELIPKTRVTKPMVDTAPTGGGKLRALRGLFYRSPIVDRMGP